MVTKFTRYLYRGIIHVSWKFEENPIKNEKVIKNYVFTSITMFVDLEIFRLGQLLVRLDGVGTPHPTPHPKTIQIESKYCCKHIL